jgi:voltage-gated potassium channel Kch
VVPITVDPRPHTAREEARRLREEEHVTARGRTTATMTAFRTSVVVTLVAAGVVVFGGWATWMIERDVPGRTFDSWGDSVWWAVTTLTTVGYGDHVPITTGGRVVGGIVMIAGVAVLGGVAAVVALVVARVVASAEEQALEAEAESIERRVERRLDDLDGRLARIERHLRHLAEARSDIE